jgi:hypothetical protein
MYISTNGMNFGWCLDQTRAGEWVDYTIQVLAAGNYVVEAQVEGLGTNGTFEAQFLTNGTAYANTGTMVIPSNGWTTVSAVVGLAAGTSVMKLSFLTNGTANGSPSGYVGRFDYISIYAYCPTTTIGMNTIAITTNQLLNLCRNAPSR